MMSNLPMWILAVALCAAGAVVTVDAQDVPSCASNLVACSAYMNVTNPPESCCKPLKQAIDTQLECLCNLYSILPSLGINVTQARTLQTRCGISGDISACGTAESPGSSTTPAGVPGIDKNGAENIASAGVLGCLVVFFIWFM